MADIYERSLKQHEAWQGKISTESKAVLATKDDLSLAYSPGVAAPCLAIEKVPHDAYKYTWKGNTVAVISDGSAVLGLGDIGAQASLPVMEGKCVLFKQFGGVNAVPIVLDTQDTEEIIRTVKLLAPTFGGINLEDISAPRCVEIETRLKEELDIPVFHDDQHGTAIVVTAGLINALKLVGKRAEDCTVVVSGVGAAGSSCIRMMLQLGIKRIYGFNSKGILNKKHADTYTNPLYQDLAEITNPDGEDLSLVEAVAKSDIFLGVSMPGILTPEMTRSMKDNAIVFALANPEPEINYDLAREAGARIVATGRSDFPNQVNNVLAFPGLFRGALDVQASKITDEMKMAAAVGLAAMIPENELAEERIIPGPFEPGVADTVAKAVSEMAVAQGLSRI